MKKAAKAVAIFLAAAAVLVILFLTVYTVQEYRPKAVEEVEVRSAAGSDAAETDIGIGLGEGARVQAGETLKILTFNIGYGGLGAAEDFFMDGGERVRPDSREVVEGYLDGIAELVTEQKPDMIMLQEIDRDAKRSYGIDELAWLGERLTDELPEATYSSAFAMNFDVLYVPYPFPETIGAVEAGLATWNRFEVASAERIALPTSYTWPIRTCQLKRCLLVERLPLAEGGKELVLVNLHLEAYDDGSGKAAQTKVLMDFLAEEYAKGNYCIAGGDFNQTFETTDTSAYPLVDTDYFEAGIIKEAALPEGFSFVADSRTPSARLLNMPYDSANERTQYYVIDGFLVSDNVTITKVETLAEEFQNSDHNPVLLEAVLAE